MIVGLQLQPSSIIKYATCAWKKQSNKCEFDAQDYGMPKMQLKRTISRSGNFMHALSHMQQPVDGLCPTTLFFHSPSHLQNVKFIRNLDSSAPAMTISWVDAPEFSKSYYAPYNCSAVLQLIALRFNREAKQKDNLWHNDLWNIKQMLRHLIFIIFAENWHIWFGTELTGLTPSNHIWFSSNWNGSTGTSSNTPY